MKRLCAILLLLAGCSAPSPHGIPNFAVVDTAQGIYRGGQPEDPRGWDYLYSIGVTNVVKLNLDSEGLDDEAFVNGCQQMDFPIDLEHQTIFKPSGLTVSNAVAAITRKTFVHCSHGQDRTGLVVACYRVWRQGWTKSAARKEMLDLGFHRELHGLDDYWEDNVK